MSQLLKKKGANIFFNKRSHLVTIKSFLLIVFLFSTSISFAKEIVISPGEDAQERLQEALILMNEGDTLIIKSGYYSFEDVLSLDVNNVTVTGEGMEETVLDFKNQQSNSVFPNCNPNSPIYQF